MATVCALAGCLVLACAQWLIFYYAPVEATLGIIQKIFYLHMPLAWWGLFSFFLVFIGSIYYLLAKKPRIDRFCAACAETGVLFSCLALLSGMIWAKKSWGVWWTWDPRLSTSLVMCFIYAGYLIFRHLDLTPARTRMISAVIGIVAFLDVPLVFLSARIFRSIHPAVFASQSGGLEAEMKLTAIICALGMGLLWFSLLLFRQRQLAFKDNVERLLMNRSLNDTLD